MDTGTIAIFMVLVSILCMCLTIGISMIVYQVTHLKGIIKVWEFYIESMTKLITKKKTK